MDPLQLCKRSSTYANRSRFQVMCDASLEGALDLRKAFFFNNVHGAGGASANYIQNTVEQFAEELLEAGYQFEANL